MKTRTTTLLRTLRLGDTLTFDQGRIKLELQEKSGRTARLKLTMAQDVVIDKPRVAANDEKPGPEAPMAPPLAE